MPDILPASVSTPMTRPSLGYKRGGHEALRKVTIPDFPEGRDGLWLPPEWMAQRDHEAMQRELGVRALHAARGTRQMTRALYQLYAGARYISATGCAVPRQRARPLGDHVHTEMLWSAMAHETGHDVLSRPEQKDELRLCEEPQCLSPRHYDIVQGLKNRDRLVEPNYGFYEAQANGSIATAWGDILPPVTESKAKLRELQLLCPPFTDEAVALLTLSGISKLGFDFKTGCWPVSTYYSRQRPKPYSENQQYDGYGRLGIRKVIQETLGLPPSNSSQYFAHRAIWRVMGNEFAYDERGRPMVLNHLCGYRCCCNPQHIVQETTAQNNAHGRRMQYAMAQLAHEKMRLPSLTR